MIRQETKQKIKFSAAIFIIFVAIAIASFTVLKYQVEGEKVVPYKIGKIIVINKKKMKTIIKLILIISTLSISSKLGIKLTKQYENENLNNYNQNTQQEENTQTEPVAQEENYLWN